ncbi:MAG: radical SAM protein [Rhodospirillales bacterium]|nr:radical SAM protein [Rhodospirillales bacterium]
MADGNLAERPVIDPRKFRDPDVTANGEERAVVALTRLRTLWFNTGSLCNITCRNCYMDSSPKNDSLAYITQDDVIPYLDEISATDAPVEEIAFTGGEPFMNSELPKILGECMTRGFRTLVLSNAMKPMYHKRAELLDLRNRFGNALSIRVSMDHFESDKHEAVRGQDSWAPMLDGLKWLAQNKFDIAVAGRTCWNEEEDEARRGYAAVFAEHAIPIDAMDPAVLVLFPEMDSSVDVPEITVKCWDILGVAPETMMCATSRMVIKRKGAQGPVVVPCTLLPYDPDFEMGDSLSSSGKVVKLNHPHCARFCVLGGASCSPD